MQRYVMYKRVSTEDQGKSGLGLDAQDRDIRIYLETYSPEPWEVVGEFVEMKAARTAAGGYSVSRGHAKRRPIG